MRRAYEGVNYELVSSDQDGKQKDFEVAQEYEFADFQKAIQHVSSPGKAGIVLLKSPI